MKSFEEYIKNNPEILENNPNKAYYAQTPERQEQFTTAVEKLNMGFPRQAIIKWLQNECGWTIAPKTISDYLGQHAEK